VSPLPARPWLAVLAVLLAGSMALPSAWGASPAATAPAPPAGSTAAPIRPVAKPEITNVEPPTPVKGRAVELTIYGTGFSEDQANIQVSCGGVAAASIDVQSPHRIVATFPPFEKIGAATVTVINPNGDRADLPKAIYIRPGGGFDLTALWYQMQFSKRGFFEWFQLGGWLMYVFLAISFLGVAWAVHCFLVLRRSQIVPESFLKTLCRQLDQGDLRGATAACERSGCVFSRVAAAGLQRAGEALESPDKVRESMGAAGSREAAHLHQKISYLANIGTISPMLGLLGTVFGMIMAFNLISTGEPRPYLLAAAIAKAMVTTASGLVIGIPALAIYFYLRGRLLRLVTHMEVVADEVGNTIIEKAEEL